MLYKWYLQTKNQHYKKHIYIQTYTCKKTSYIYIHIVERQWDMIHSNDYIHVQPYTCGPWPWNVYRKLLSQCNSDKWDSAGARIGGWNAFGTCGFPVAILASFDEQAIFTKLLGSHPGWSFLMSPGDVLMTNVWTLRICHGQLVELDVG